MNKYSLSMRIMHWTVSVMIITLLCVGTYMTDLPYGDEKLQIYTMHKSFGLITFILILIRIAARLSSDVPALPSAIKPMEAKIASWTVALFYLCMVLMPLSGYIMSMAGGRGINFLGTGHMVPDLIGIYPDFANIAGRAHGVVAVVLTSLIALHIIGAIKHLVIDKMNLFKRMI